MRKGRGRGREEGFLATWDVNSADRRAANRVYRFVFGDEVHRNGRAYRYPGFVEKPGVRYLGQSTLFVKPALLREIDGFLTATAIDHEVISAAVG